MKPNPLSPATGRGAALPPQTGAASASSSSSQSAFAPAQHQPASAVRTSPSELTQAEAKASLSTSGLREASASHASTPLHQMEARNLWKRAVEGDEKCFSELSRRVESIEYGYSISEAKNKQEAQYYLGKYCTITRSTGGRPWDQKYAGNQKAAFELFQKASLGVKNLIHPDQDLEQVQQMRELAQRAASELRTIETLVGPKGEETDEVYTSNPYELGSMAGNVSSYPLERVQRGLTGLNHLADSHDPETLNHVFTAATHVLQYCTTDQRQGIYFRSEGLGDDRNVALTLPFAKILGKVVKNSPQNLSTEERATTATTLSKILDSAKRMRHAYNDRVHKPEDLLRLAIDEKLEFESVLADDQKLESESVKVPLSNHNVAVRAELTTAIALLNLLDSTEHIDSALIRQVSSALRQAGDQIFEAGKYGWRSLSVSSFENPEHIALFQQLAVTVSKYALHPNEEVRRLSQYWFTIFLKEGVSEQIMKPAIQGLLHSMAIYGYDSIAHDRNLSHLQALQERIDLFALADSRKQRRFVGELYRQGKLISRRTDTFEKIVKTYHGANLDTDVKMILHCAKMIETRMIGDEMPLFFAPSEEALETFLNAPDPHLEQEPTSIQAMRWYERALELDPQNQEALAAVARLRPIVERERELARAGFAALSGGETSLQNLFLSQADFDRAMDPRSTDYPLQLRVADELMYGITPGGLLRNENAEFAGDNEARRLYLNVVENGSDPQKAYALNALGLMEPNRSNARELFEVAIQLGNANSMVNLRNLPPENAAEEEAV